MPEPQKQAVEKQHAQDKLLEEIGRTEVDQAVDEEVLMKMVEQMLDMSLQFDQLGLLRRGR